MTYTRAPKLPRVASGVPIPPASRHALRETALVAFVRSLRVGQSFTVPHSRASGFAVAFGRALIAFERRPDPKRRGAVRFWRVRSAKR